MCTIEKKIGTNIAIIKIYLVATLENSSGKICLVKFFYKQKIREVIWDILYMEQQRKIGICFRPLFSSAGETLTQIVLTRCVASSQALSLTTRLSGLFTAFITLISPHFWTGSSYVGHFYKELSFCYVICNHFNHNVIIDEHPYNTQIMTYFKKRYSSHEIILYCQIRKTLNTLCYLSIYTRI